MKLRPVKNKKRALLFFPVSVLLALILTLIFPSRREMRLSPPSQPSSPVEKQTSAPLVEIERLIIPRGKTITDLLTKYGLTVTQVIEIREKVKPVYDLARIPAGQELRLVRQNGEYLKLELDLDAERYLEINLKGDQPKASLRFYPLERKLALVEGTIEDSLIATVNKAGEQDLLALMLAEIFGWDIDFYVDLRKGDTFRLLVEKKYINGQFSSYGRILAAYFLNKGQLFEAFRFEYADSGQADYFDSKGNSLRRQFLKSPLRYARITSRFSFSRFHPIRKIYRPHYGVDYAAPVGTPVQATAPGVVTYTGWNGGAGRMIKIRHNNSYETMYLHLKAFAPGVYTGTRVQGGQEIGYVGSSGESTGPHLDYRLLYHGKYINPLGWRFQPAKPLSKEYLPEFSRQVNILKSLLLFPLGYI